MYKDLRVRERAKSIYMYLPIGRQAVIPLSLHHRIRTRRIDALLSAQGVTVDTSVEAHPESVSTILTLAAEVEDFGHRHHDHDYKKY